MHPPEFLIPLQLLGRESLAIHKIIDTAKFIIPTIFQHLQSRVLSLHYQFRAFQPLTQIHDKPHGFNGMPRSNLTSFKTVYQTIVAIQALNNNSSKFRTQEHLHHLVNARIHCFYQKILVKQMLYF